ncbi:MAG: pilus assembly protein [Chloroflexi bacterium]|nr:MAG: pilus assembly protein [Chloroflexota bacterium]
MSQFIRRRAKRRAGQALLEFTMVIPVFFLLLVGIIDFGRIGLYFVASTDLARSGARYATNYNNGAGFSNAEVVAYVKQQAQGLAMANLTQASCAPATPPKPITSATASCYKPSVGNAYIFIDRGTPSSVTVSIVYAFEATTPMVRTFFPTYYLESSATMSTEY